LKIENSVFVTITNKIGIIKMKNKNIGPSTCCKKLLRKGGAGKKPINIPYATNKNSISTAKSTGYVLINLFI
jgi:hypothetical protein